ncbi:hypothetical protein H5410_017169 [Solanum commersonii]|uniref:Uncharacterized protein n=1 Tax=Solanum commersonii TaxID=4109 RepID=A0A9J5ZYJ7_SOLCO|nr:hypothetical protein H5410_017169 [Solanum commersonii]
MQILVNNFNVKLVSIMWGLAGNARPNQLDRKYRNRNLNLPKTNFFIKKTKEIVASMQDLPHPENNVNLVFTLSEHFPIGFGASIYLIAAKVVVDELARLLKEAEAVVQSINCSLVQVGELNVDNGTNSLENYHDEAEASSVDPL